MTWKEKFLRFLKEENVYGEWIYNLRQQHPTTDFIFWKVKLKEIFSEEKKCAEAIIYAFCWRRTKQGYEYWRTLSSKWKAKCRNYFYNI